MRINATCVDSIAKVTIAVFGSKGLLDGILVVNATLAPTIGQTKSNIQTPPETSGGYASASSA